MKGEESLVDDFAAFILGMLEHDEAERDILLVRRYPSVMHGMTVGAKSDVCVMSESESEDLLHVQEDNVCPPFSLIVFLNPML